MKQLKIKEKAEYLTPDFVYIPINSKDDLLIQEENIHKNDKVTLNKVSPVSGKASAFASIMTLEGIKQTLMIENDFRDKKSNTKFANKDIYKISKSSIKKVININSEELNIIVSKTNDYDLKDSFILKDYIREILETINIIDQTYDNLKTKIIINRDDISTYELLFNYIGTYPNIEIAFEYTKGVKVSLYNMIDIYNILKNSNVRDYIYVSIRYKNEVEVIKLKKYTNLKEIINLMNIDYKKILVNERVELTDSNLILDESIYEIKLI